MMERRLIPIALAASWVLVSSLAAADVPDATTLGLFTDVGYLASPGTNGSAFGVGLRAALGRHFAVSFDVGYGVLGAQSAVQDRWWLVPSIALVVPTRVAQRPVVFDLGAGVGLGASSGYLSWSDYVAAPFTPVWAFQLFPTVRAHAIVAVAINRDLEVLVRADAASVLGTDRGAMDTTWLMLSLGARFRLL
jgi:hypothetical protein